MELEWNQEKNISTPCFILSHVLFWSFVRCDHLSFIWLSGFELAFLHIIHSLGMFLASFVLIPLVSLCKYLKAEDKKTSWSHSKKPMAHFTQIWCWLRLASREVAESLSGEKHYLKWSHFFLALGSEIIYSFNNLNKASDNQITKNT